jgi:hypothetical protein
VRQASGSVDIAITGAVGALDFVDIRLQLPAVEVMGPHHSDVGFALAADNDNSVSASLDGEDYYSRLGDVDFTLSEDGSITGSFSVSLASAEGIGARDVVLEVGDEVTRLEGTFNGGWVLSCYSMLPGHETWVSGGEFCETFEF